MQWFATKHSKNKAKLEQLSDQLMQFDYSNDPLKFWDKSKITICLPMVPHAIPTKASHPQMSLADYEEAKAKIEDLLQKGLIRPSSNPWACKALFVNNHSKQKHGKKHLVINYKPLNQFLIANKFSLPLKDSLLAKLKMLKFFLNLI